MAGQIFVFLIGALAVAGFGILIEFELGHPNLSQISVADLALYAALSAIFVLPMLYLTIWPATLLSPARVGLLLMSEVVVGLVSAAFLAGEPFGWREGLGAAMIVSAAVLELVPTRSKS
ncbi:MAG: hypothetical protein AAFY03_10645 [Pseudomonadota bacterium]